MSVYTCFLTYVCMYLHIHCCHYYHVIACFKGVEKLETEERRELPESDVLPSASLLDIYETEDAEYRPGNRGESQ